MKLPLSLLVASLLPLLASCGEDDDDDDHRTGERCLDEGATRCDGQSFESCTQGEWYIDDLCSGSTLCDENLGCVQCDPFFDSVCVDDAVYECTSDGRLGELQASCPAGQCRQGACEGAGDCAAGTELIYVVDSQHRLLSFDPHDDVLAFTLLGNLTCSADAAFPEWGASTATPFSMSVDRTGIAWILYTSGQIFWVPVHHANQCVESSWEPGTNGFELFGMGFVTDAPGSTDETLFITGGSASQMSSHTTDRLGAMTADAAWVEDRGNLESLFLSPELTGTGNAELWAYFPGTEGATVARVDKLTGANELDWLVPGLQDAVTAWAFAHWGGRYYIFVSTQGLGDLTWNSQVHRFDPVTGTVEKLLENLPYRIVGAGVSTCAPVIVQ